MTKVDELWLPFWLVNKAQARRWNGDGGRYWIEHRERHVTEQLNLTPHLFRAAEISYGERVLDVGCGCGHTTIKAAQATAATAEERVATCVPHPDGARLAAGAIGVDLSAPMLDVAWRLAEQSGTTNVEFVQGDAQKYPFRPNSFDIAISSFGVMFFNNPWRAFEHLATVVRPDGRLAFLCWQDDTKNEVFELPFRAFGPYRQMPDPDPIIGLFYNPTKITHLLTLTGWKDIQIISIREKVCIGSNLDDVMSYVRGMPTVCALVSSFEDRALQDKILDEVKAEYADRARPDGVWVDAAAWLVTARRA